MFSAVRASPPERCAISSTTSSDAAAPTSARPRRTTTVDLLGRQRLELVHLRAGDERGVDLVVRVLGRRADQRHEALLDARQQRVLLRLVEAVDLVEEEDRAPAGRAEPLPRPREHLAHVLHRRRHRRQLLERRAGRGGDDPRERRLPAAGRAVQDRGVDAVLLDRAPQRRALAEDVLLADELAERRAAAAAARAARPRSRAGRRRRRRGRPCRQYAPPRRLPPTPGAARATSASRRPLRRSTIASSRRSRRAGRRASRRRLRDGRRGAASRAGRRGRDRHRHLRRPARQGAPRRGGRGSRDPLRRGRLPGASLRGRGVRRGRFRLRRDLRPRPRARRRRAGARLPPGRPAGAHGVAGRPLVGDARAGGPRRSSKTWTRANGRTRSTSAGCSATRSSSSCRPANGVSRRTRARSSGSSPRRRCRRSGPGSRNRARRRGRARRSVYLEALASGVLARNYVLVPGTRR